MSFVSLVTTALANNKYIVFKLNAVDIAFLNRILASAPQELQSTIIGKDGVSVADIPILVLSFIQVLQKYLVSTDVNVNIINITNFVLDTVISALPINQDEIDILKETLDYSIQLLRTNIIPLEQDEAICCGWLRKHFF